MGHTSAGRGVNGTDLVGSVSSFDIPRVSWGGEIPLASTLFGGARLITLHLRRLSLGECRRGPWHFWECQAHVGSGPASGSTLKRPCTTLIRLVGQPTNTVDLIGWIQLMGYTSAGRVWSGVMSLDTVVSWGCLARVPEKPSIRVMRPRLTFLEPQGGLLPRLQLSLEGLGLSPGSWVAPF